MKPEEILREIEKLSPNERLLLRMDCAKDVSDLRWVLLTHPDQEMVKAACLHFLGDDAQKWYSECEANQESEMRVWNNIETELEKSAPVLTPSPSLQRALLHPLNRM